MTDDQIELVQLSFRQVMRSRETASMLFYDRLFELDPSLRRLFPDDLARQRHDLMVTLSVLIGNLRFIDGLVPSIQALARRHIAYGARPEHFPIVGAALLWTLSQRLGDSFTPEVESAWLDVFDLLAGTMQSAMAEPELKRAA